MAAARDRAYSEEDSGRLAVLYSRLAGEVWAVGQRIYWFNEPMAAWATASLLDRSEPGHSGMLHS